MFLDLKNLIFNYLNNLIYLYDLEDKTLYLKHFYIFVNWYHKSDLNWKVWIRRRKRMEKYELVEENVGIGKVAVVKLMRHRETKEHVAVKFIPRDLTVHSHSCTFIFFQQSSSFFYNLGFYSFNVQFYYIWNRFPTQDCLVFCFHIKC